LCSLDLETGFTQCMSRIHPCRPNYTEYLHIRFFSNIFIKIIRFYSIIPCDTESCSMLFVVLQITTIRDSLRKIMGLLRAQIPDLERRQCLIVAMPAVRQLWVLCCRRFPGQDGSLVLYVSPRSARPIAVEPAIIDLNSFSHDARFYPSLSVCVSMYFNSRAL